MPVTMSMLIITCLSTRRRLVTNLMTPISRPPDVCIGAATAIIRSLVVDCLPTKADMRPVMRASVTSCVSVSVPDIRLREDITSWPFSSMNCSSILSASSNVSVYLLALSW